MKVLLTQVGLFSSLVVIFLITAANGLSQVKYVGCMKQTTGSTSFAEKAKTFPKWVNVKYCVAKCWEMRRKFAGLQNGDRCFCSATLVNVVAVSENECYIRCSANCQQLCGGEKTLSVYQTGYKREPVFPLAKKMLLKANIGCYDRLSATRILCQKKPVLNTVRLTAAMCVYFCASVHNAKFSTTNTIKLCCCSDTVSGARNNRLEYCNIPCKGDTTNEVGCVGKHRYRPVSSTFQMSRLPPFKRWPASLFTDADWKEPQFPDGETFEIKDSPIVTLEDDPSLSGLVAKRLVSETASEKVSAGGPNVVAEKAVVSLAGGDQREQTLGGVAKSVAISEVSGRAEAEAPTSTEGNKLIVAAVVVAFVIIIVATGFYFYKSHETDIDEDEEKDNKRRRRAKKESDESDSD
ncbi:hypothetical protein RRG08_000556 [Elysia crispata]|uniref:WSC domain-containing protein n=1 Tax=Elysia crispata TaxID=231223 RepID=A0AAE1CUX6_9GAST|nr:hypothetical protein RRG08_000556 [Elysia crispata]